MDIITARSHQINHSRKKANVAGNNTGVRKKPSADEFDGDFLMDYDEK